MIERAIARDLIRRGVGRYYNKGRRPMIRFTMSEGLRRREVANLIAANRIKPTCMEDYHCPVQGAPWSSADGFTITTPAQDRKKEAQTRSEAAKRGWQYRKAMDLSHAYQLAFPQYRGGILSDEILAAMALALKTGIEGPELVAERERIERNCAEYDARLAAEHAAPFTPDLEKHYTAKVKERRIREGDCERPWQNYFAYRDAHPNEVEPLDATDLAYVGQWTSCATMKAA